MTRGKQFALFGPPEPAPVKQKCGICGAEFKSACCPNCSGMTGVCAYYKALGSRRIKGGGKKGDLP